MSPIAVSLLMIASAIDSTRLSIRKLNVDSLTDIDVDMQRAHVILASKKSGEIDTILYDKGGRLSLLEIAPDLAWMLIKNPAWSIKKGNCEVLLCALEFGLCRCKDVIADSGYYLSNFSKRSEGGAILIKRNSQSGYSKKSAKIEKLLLQETEMRSRFRFQKPVGGSNQ